MSPELPFAQRLATARRMIAAGPTVTRPAEHVQARIDAAVDECLDELQHVGFVVANLAPERGWRQRVRADDPDQRAYLLAAVLDCMRTQCPHLRQGPQPAYALLPLRRLDCRKCATVPRLPAPADADRCDVCGERGVTHFVPFAVAAGPTLVSGDACSSCAGVLGIGRREAA
jgi:hypothetical protein